MSCFRRPFGNQRVNVFQTLLKSARHHYYPIFRCIWDILSWKKSALVWSEILRLFVKTLTADNRYSRCNVLNFAQKVQTLYLENKRIFLDFLLHFWNMHQIQNIRKKRWVSYPNFFRNYWFRQNCLLKRLKCDPSEDHSVINVLTGSKHYWN